MYTSLQVIAVITIDVLIQDFVRNGATSGPARATANAAIFFLLMIIYLVCSLVLIYAAEKVKSEKAPLAMADCTPTGNGGIDGRNGSRKHWTHIRRFQHLLLSASDPFLLQCRGHTDVHHIMVPDLLVGGGGRKLPEARNAGHHAATQQLARLVPPSKEFLRNADLLGRAIRTPSLIRFLCSRMMHTHYSKE
ncbi:unnamed protein product [Darwinula stevensoni]|uniref:Uncharacterized protein n=1 Tax=Darwinula stevensoni TaxID=69355 RepID=A0A7R9AEF1_9CRUS|nr:unnamed protein product [Darwinula stevensoni]CAG0901402.1 unnamed protein product [Darwinula stevensoni]